MLKLRLLTGPRAGRQLRVSDTKPISIGRRKGRLRLHDSRVSKEHAEIYFADGLWLLRDLGSANGTYINRKRVKGLVELEPDDRVQMGRVLMKIVRCDTIGMDTQPFEPSASTQTTDDTKHATVIPAGEALDPFDDDFDVEALLSDSDDISSDEKQDSGAGIGLERPAKNDFEVDSGVEGAAADVNSANIDDDAGVSETADDLDDAEIERMSAAFDALDDDDDSFFGELGEATAASSASADSADDDVTPGQADDDAEQPTDLDSLSGDVFDRDDTASSVIAEGEPADSADNSDEPDPFLASEDQTDAEPTDDLISLNDEPGIGSPSAGTTLLTAAHDDGTPVDQAEQSDAAGFDSSETQAVAHDADDDDEDEAPTLVGLALGQAPPQQPAENEQDTVADDVTADAEVASELSAVEEAETSDLVDEPDDSASQPVDQVEPGVELEDGVWTADESRDDPVVEMDNAAHAVSEPRADDEAVQSDDVDEVAGSVSSDKQDNADGLADREFKIDEPSFEIDNADELSDSALFDALDLDDEPEPLLDVSDEVEAPEIAASDETGDKHTPSEQDADVASPFSNLDMPPGIKMPLHGLFDDAKFDRETDDDLNQAIDDIPELVLDGPAKNTQEDADQRDRQDNAELVTDRTDSDADALAPSESDAEDSDFDIDAAFDALSEGLDDTVDGAPALDDVSPDDAVDASDDRNSPDNFDAFDEIGDGNGDDHESPMFDDVVDPPDSTPSDELIGSQLDVGFIKDALSKLEHSESTEDTTKAEEDASRPEASAAIVKDSDSAKGSTPIDEKTIEPTDDTYVQSPPPGLTSSGLNPTSVLPPTETTRGRTPKKGIGRWFFSLLLLLAVGSVGGYLISQNYDRLVGQRIDPAASSGTEKKPHTHHTRRHNPAQRCPADATG